MVAKPAVSSRSRTPESVILKVEYLIASLEILKGLNVGRSSLFLLESYKSLKQALFMLKLLSMAPSADYLQFCLVGFQRWSSSLSIHLSQFVKPIIYIWSTMIRGYSHIDSPYQSLVVYMYCFLEELYPQITSHSQNISTLVRVSQARTQDFLLLTFP